MKRHVSLFVLLAASTATAAAGGNAGAHPEGAERPRVLANGFIDAWNRHDIGAFAALYTIDADFVNVIGLRLRGRAEIQKHHETLHASRMKASHLEALETDIRLLRPDVALVHVRWELSNQLGPDGASLPTRQGILSHVMVKSGGKWLIASSQNTDTVSMPSPSVGR
jgi:uncharacterized protein (TIGR02246 family)